MSFFESLLILLLAAIALLQISRLANPAYLLEVEAIAILPPKT